MLQLSWSLKAISYVGGVNEKKKDLNECYKLLPFMQMPLYFILIFLLYFNLDLYEDFLFLLPWKEMRIFFGCSLLKKCMLGNICKRKLIK